MSVTPSFHLPTSRLLAQDILPPRGPLDELWGHVVASGCSWGVPEAMMGGSHMGWVHARDGTDLLSLHLRLLPHVEGHGRRWVRTGLKRVRERWVWQLMVVGGGAREGMA